MRDEILRKLSELTDEELSYIDGAGRSKKNMYSKSGRFIIERRTISNISTGEATAPVCLRSHPRFQEFPEHTHDFVEMMYVCAGAITHRIANRTVRVAAGNIIVLGKNTKHSIEPSDYGDIGVNIIISADLFEIMLGAIRRDSALNTKSLESFLDHSHERFRVFPTAQNIEIGNLLENMIFSNLVRQKTEDYLLEQSIRLLCCYLCALSDAPADEDEVSYTELTKKRIIKYIRSTYSTATLTEVAQMLGLSPTYLSRWICANFGKSFKQLLMDERFSVAKDLLATTRTPIGDIIINVGYENSSYFHKEFKKRFGMTPNEYRKDAKDAWDV